MGQESQDTRALNVEEEADEKELAMALEHSVVGEKRRQGLREKEYEDALKYATNVASEDAVVEGVLANSLLEEGQRECSAHSSHDECKGITYLLQMAQLKSQNEEKH